MKKSEVQIGQTYMAKVSGKVVRVRIDTENRHGGWNATNLETNKKVHIKSVQRLRCAAGDEAAPASEPVGSTPGEQGIAAARAEAVAIEEGFDPERCATPDCDGVPALTYLGRPLCQECWERHCQAEASGESAPATAAPADEVDAQADPPGDVATGANDGGQDAALATAAPEPAAAQAAAAKPKRISALDAAARILESEGRPMRTKELIELMAARALWSSPNGKTPEATLYAAILREITTKGERSRFRKVERGQFASTALVEV